MDYIGRDILNVYMLYMSDHFLTWINIRVVFGFIYSTFKPELRKSNTF